MKNTELFFQIGLLGLITTTHPKHDFIATNKVLQKPYHLRMAEITVKLNKVLVLIPQTECETKLREELGEGNRKERDLYTPQGH